MGQLPFNQDLERDHNVENSPRHVTHPGMPVVMGASDSDSMASSEAFNQSAPLGP